jgi:2-haloacid dehalogenase
VDFGDFEALSFDCYGTLIDWEAGIAAVLRRWADAHGLTLPDEQLLAVFSGQESAAEAAHPADLYPDILARSMRGLGAELGVPVSDDEARALAVSVPDWPAFPDSADALARLARRYRLIILSNVDRASFAGSNRRLGVTFTSILTAQDIGSYKPSPRNFEALAA